MTAILLNTAWVSRAAGCGRPGARLSAALIACLLAFLLASPVEAHGPAGDHHHESAAPAAPAPALAPAPARTESHSPTWELVATLGGGELSVLVDRYATNEPVTDAQVTVISGGLQAIGTFHADHGDHAFTDERLLARLSQPGRHELVFTVTQGGTSEEVRSVLVTPPATADHAHGERPHTKVSVTAIASIAALALALAVAFGWWSRRRPLQRAEAASTELKALAATAAMALAAAAGGLSPQAWAGPGAHGPDGQHLDEPPATSGPDRLMRLPDGSVQLPKRAQRSMGIRTAVTSVGEHASTLSLHARVVPDPRSAGQVQAPVAGRIAPPPAGLPVAGQTVRKGQVLARLEPVLGAAELTAQQASLAELRANRMLVQRRVDRLLQLQGVVPDKDIEAARLELQSLRERERLTSQALQGSRDLVAPVSGVLASARAVAGQLVEPQGVLFEVVDPQRVLIEARVTDPTQAAQVTGGAVAGLPDVRLEVMGAARVYRDGGVPLTFLARSAGTVLALGQPLTVVATLGGGGAPVRSGVAVAAEAVVRNAANQPTVWVKTSAERFQPVTVQTQPLDGQRLLVTQGLQAGQRVVVQGASLINQVR